MTRLDRGTPIRTAIALLSVACSSASPPKVDSSPMTPASQPAGLAAESRKADAPDEPKTTPTEVADAGVANAGVTNAGVTSEQPAPAPERETVAPVAEPKFLPIDVMTGPEMAYLIDYANSGASEAAKKNCVGKPDEDPDKKAECLAKAREKFGADVLRFRKDERGRHRLVIYRRNGSSLVELFSGNVELKETGPNVVRVDLKGGSGQRPIWRDKSSFEVKVPNGYSIEIEDSVYGRLPYDAKVGFVGK